VPAFPLASTQFLADTTWALNRLNELTRAVEYFKVRCSTYFRLPATTCSNFGASSLRKYGQVQVFITLLVWHQMWIIPFSNKTVVFNVSRLAKVLPSALTPTLLKAEPDSDSEQPEGGTTSPQSHYKSASESSLSSQSLSRDFQGHGD
jgi:hypothetical protein